LQAESSIGEINVFNRTDNCCIARLSNFTVYVINENGDTTFSKTFTNAPDPSVSVNAEGVLGKVVKIVLNGTNPLSLAEVQVFGKLLSVDKYFSEISLYPNPVEDQLHLSLDNLGIDLTHSSVTLFNINGQIVKKIAVKNEGKIILELKDLYSGVYLLQIRDNNKIFTEKIIKQ
jgi:hypothetical protein